MSRSLSLLLILCSIFMLSCGNINTLQQEYDARLFDAIKAADSDAIVSALNQGANPNADTGNDGTALCTLIQQYKRSHNERKSRIELCTKEMLRFHADPERLHHGFTPLQIAAGQGSDVIVNHLIQYGADPSIETKSGLAPIWQAVHTNNYRVGAVLLRGGANPNALNNDGLTPLQYLRNQGRTKTRLMILLRHYGGR